MTLANLKIAKNNKTPLYIDDKEIEISFIDELTETIEVIFSQGSYSTFVTKGTISIRKKYNIVAEFGSGLIMRRGDKYV